MGLFDGPVTQIAGDLCYLRDVILFHIAPILHLSEKGLASQVLLLQLSEQRWAGGVVGLDSVKQVEHVIDDNIKSHIASSNLNDII